MTGAPSPTFTETQLELHGYFDDQLNDPHNFGLSDDVVGVYSAVLTGVVMLILVDLAYRIVVRARGSGISSHMVHRRFVLSTALNPVQWRNLWSEPNDRPDAHCDATLDSEMPTHVSDNMTQEKLLASTKTIAVFISGVLLLSTELLLIFFTTTTEYPVRVDSSRMPSLSLREVQGRSRSKDMSDSCRKVPLTSKPGFEPRMDVSVCILPLEVRRVPVPSGLENIAAVLIETYLKKVFVVTILRGEFQVHELLVRISVHDGDSYTVRSDISRNETARTLSKALYAWGYNLLHVGMEDTEGGWRVSTFVDVVGPPAPVHSEHEHSKRDNRSDNELWLLHLKRVATGIFNINSSDRAYTTHAMDGPFLDEEDERPLFILRRPVISIGGLIVLLLCEFCVWAFVALVMKWSPGLDERWAWIKQFSEVQGVNDEWTSFPEESFVVAKK